MKKLFQFLMMAAIVFGAVLSCSKENAPDEDKPAGGEEVLPPEEGDEYVTLHLVAEFEGQGEPAPASVQADTKMSAMDDSGNFTWADGDVVKVLYAGGETTAAASVTDNKATFSPTIKAGTEEVWLVYPASAGVTLSGGKLVVPMPEVQKNGLSGLFVAKALASDTKAAFCHPICYYKVDVDGDGSDVTRMEITSGSGANLTATSLTVDFDANMRPSVESVTGGAATIDYSFSGVGSYYFPVVPGTAELAADDLTFQFYREVDAQPEKAGAYQYSKALTNARAAIINWGSLPEKATNRYVEENPSGSRTGSSLNPWSYTEFAEFISNKDSHLSTEDISRFNGVKIHFAEGFYSFRNAANKLKTGIKLYILGAGSEKAAGDTDYSHTTRFDGGSRSSVNGYIIRQNETDTSNEMTIVFRDIRFQYANRTDDNGGVFNIKFGKFIFENCNFNNNKAASTTSGKGGGGVANIYTPETVEFRNCVFEENSAVENAGVIYKSGSGSIIVDGCTFKKNSALEGGAIYQTGGTSTITNCDFENNTVSNNNNWRGGGAICVTGTSTVTNISGCKFTGNTADNGSGGAIRVNQSVARIANSVIEGNSAKRGGAVLAHTQGKCFMHNVRIINNNASDGWGLVTQTSDEGTLVCGNNLTVMDNHKGTSNGGAVFNHNKASLLLVNTTVINKADGIVRWADNAVGTFYVLNSILLNTVTTSPAILFSVTITGTSGGNSIIGNVSGSGFTAAASDKTGQTYNESDWTWDSTNRYYTWSGSFGGTNYSTDGITTSDIQGLVAAQNSDFANWVTGIDPNGFTTDTRKIARGTKAWPGSYDN